MLRGEGVDPDEKVADDGWVGVEAPIQEGLNPRDVIFLNTFIVLFDVFPLGSIEFSNWKRQIPEVLLFLEEFKVERVCEVDDRPGEDIILR